MSNTDPFKVGDTVSFLMHERHVRPDGKIGLFDKRARYTGAVIDKSDDHLRVKYTAKERVYKKDDWDRWDYREETYTDNIYVKMNSVKLVAESSKK